MLKRYSALLLIFGALSFTVASAQDTNSEQNTPSLTPPESAPQPAQPVPPPSTVPAVTAKPLVSYDKGLLLRTEDDKVTLKINLRMHTLYTYVSYDGALDESNFSISTMRLSLSGKPFLESLTYKFEAEMGKGNFILYDAFTDYAFIPKTLFLRVGLWKRPFARQFINSSARYETVDQSPVNAFFGTGYDTGLAFHNNYEKSPQLEWVVGVFNGRNANAPWVKIDPTKLKQDSTKTSDIFTSYPSRFHPVLVARAGYNHGGIEGYSEADLDGGPLRFSAAANIAYDIDYDDDGASAFNAGVDAMLKLEGLSVGGAYYLAYANANGSDMEKKGMGGFLQAGYVVAKMFEPIVRYSIVSPEEGRSYTELGAGLSVYFLKHNLKWQTFVSGLNNAPVLKGTLVAGSDTTDYSVKTQLVTAF